MADETQPHEQPPEPRIPWQQIVFDDVFLLLGLGLVVPTLLYIMWGLMDLASLDVFRP